MVGPSRRSAHHLRPPGIVIVAARTSLSIRTLVAPYYDRQEDVAMKLRCQHDGRIGLEETVDVADYSSVGDGGTKRHIG